MNFLSQNIRNIHKIFYIRKKLKYKQPIKSKLNFKSDTIFWHCKTSPEEVTHPNLWQPRVDVA